MRQTGFGPLTWLAPGVLGIVRRTPDSFVIDVLEAVEEGSGAVGRYLDALPRDEHILVPAVMNPRLAGMLERRGFARAPPPFDTHYFRFPTGVDPGPAGP